MKASSVVVGTLISAPFVVIILLLVLTAIDLIPYVKHDILSLLGLLD